jgi:hypothetical protein
LRNFAIACSANRFLSAASMKRCASLKLRWPMMLWISFTLAPASAVVSHRLMQVDRERIESFLNGAGPFK